MAAGLLETTQDDFSAGAIQSVAKHLIDRRGVLDVQNGLYDDDGSIYRRGGSKYKSNAAFGASLRWIWDGIFAAGQRTLFASPTAWGTLDVNDASPLNLGGSGLTEPPSGYALVGGILFVGGGVMYAGSRKTADYSTGTVTAPQGSKIVTGVGTTWLANVDPGMLFRVASAGFPYMVVASVDSNTQITLTEPMPVNAGAGSPYLLSRLGAVANHAGAVAGPPAAPIFATVGDRLVACSGNTITFSDGPDPGTAIAALVGAFRTFSFPAKNRHQLPDGVEIVGAYGLRDRLLVFTTGGMYQISNMAFEIVDVSGNPAHREELVAADLIAWGGASIATYGNAIVVGCTDAIYLVDGISAPEKLSRSITPKLSNHVRLGRKPGGASTYNNHYFVPVLDSSNVVVDQMVCRLDRAVTTDTGIVRPWSFQTGHGGNVIAFATRAASGAARSPTLLGAARGADARVLDLGKFFEPDDTVKNDADATTHDLQVDTRDLPTGRRLGTRNLVRAVRLRYELVDAATDNPFVIAYYGIGEIQGSAGLWGVGLWGTMLYTDAQLGELVLLQTGAPDGDGREFYVWGNEQGMRAHTEFVRFRFRSSGPCAKLVYRAVTIFSRETAKAA